MRQWLGRLARLLLVTVPSFVAGGLLMAYLAANASLVSFQMTRTGLLGKRRDGGQMRAAARRCPGSGQALRERRVHVHGGRLVAEESAERPLPLSFPFVAVVFRHAWAPGVLEHHMPRVEATYRVRLANLLIEDGRAELGAKQLTRAAELWGQNGEERVKALREQLPRIDASVPMPVELCRASDPARPLHQ